jgi:hypothetical protein
MPVGILDSPVKAAGAAAAKQQTPRLSPGGKPARRSQRVTLRMPILAFAESGRGHKHNFEEQTYVVRVSAHGGLMELDREVARGDIFMLRHPSHEGEVECRAVSISKNPSFAKKLVGFEFTDGLVDFWRMSFPPPGAKPILERSK